MKRTGLFGLVVLGLAGMIQAATITTGTAPTFVYQKDVSGNQDGNSILSDTWMNELQWFDLAGDRAWIGQQGRAEEVPMVLHFQAPEGYTIQSAQIFTSSYVRMDFWEDLALKANWGTTAHQFIWDYFADPTYYSRTHLASDPPNQGPSFVDNTSSINNVNSRDLFLTFTTYESGYDSTGYWDKEWFVTSDSATYSPGLIVTLNVVPEPVTLAMLGLGGLLLRRRK